MDQKAVGALKQVITVIQDHYEALQTAGGDDRYFLGCKIMRAMGGFTETHPRLLSRRVLGKIGRMEQCLSNGQNLEPMVKLLLEELEKEIQ